MDRVKFKVNGVEYSVGSEVSSTTTLLGYLRHNLELRGTKYMCLEGGCGSCIVSAVKTPGGDPLSINSCLVPITSCQDWDITTIEDIGNRLKGHHPIQKVLAQNHGSQCGYCSPGWIMAFYSLLQSKKPTMLEIEQYFGGNVCRCTGYRPILEAFKKFASDVPNSDILDIEDLKICNKNKETCSEKKCADLDWCFVSKSDVFTETLHIELCDKRDWYKVQTLNDVFRIWRDKGTESYMLVAGNTGKGVYPILEYPKVLIDITGISDLKGFYIDQNLVIGSGNTLTEVLNIFDNAANMEYFNYLRVLKEHLTLVAHISVRNKATLAGNLILKNEHSDFKSDIFLLLQTVGAELNIMVALGITKRLTMENFLKENMTRKIIISIVLPPLSDAHKLVTYKIMPRSQNAHAIINAGFLYKLNKSNTVVTCRIVFGGLSPEFSKAIKTEQYLNGKKLFNNETLQGALKVLDKELIVTENLPNPPADHRRKMALGLFYKGLLSLCPLNILNQRYKSGAIKLSETRPVSKAQQVFDTNPSIWPLNQPIPKIEALIQCAGEAKYTEDLPKQPNEVYAAFVLSTVGLGTIEKIDPSKALKETGVIAFFSASDIPGLNSFTPAPVPIFIANNEEVVVSNEIKYYNQPVGIIVATCQDIANKAATLVDVKYSEIKNPVTDIRIAKNNPNKITLFHNNDATTTGKDIVKVIKGENTIFGQYHFCIETLVSITYPTEEGLKIYASTQWLNCIQLAVSKMLKIPQNRIDVYVRRLGGAYGMKISRISQVAAACSLVSYKLNRPCRFIQTLTNNMRAVGKRLPCSSNFEIGVNSQGVLQYVKQDLYSDNGYIFNEPLIMMLGVNQYNNCYRKEMWSYKAYTAVTDTPSNSWCRSPGSLENIAMAEMIMERISYELSLDPLQVRLANLDTENYRDMIEILETLKQNSQYEERHNAVEKFNRDNMWKKRGLRFSFLRWTPTGGQYLNMILSVFNGDGSVAISHGGIEMGQGINTRATQVCAYLLNIPVEKVQIKANDTLKSPNGFPTGGSITSQNITVAVRKCCVELLDRLKPIKEQMNNPTWEELIKKAYDMNIDLQVKGFVNLEDVVQYNIYGITLAEVELDVLTGEFQMIRIDLIEDCGQSVNPKLDIGQIEGAFTMGAGYFTTEQLVFDPKTGELLTNRTWDYWVPQALDIPQDFRIYFRKRSYSSDLIFGSKATGEPATCMGIVVTFALRHAITAARMDSGISPTEWFQIDGPFTVNKICYSSASMIENFKFY